MRNPAPSDEWTEIVVTERLKRCDRVRGYVQGGHGEIVWEMSWVEAGRDARLDDRSRAYSIIRRLGGLVANERSLYTHFELSPAVFVGKPAKADCWHIQHFMPDYRVRVDETPPWLDDDDLRRVGLHGYQVLQMMLERVAELEARRARRTRKQ